MISRCSAESLSRHFRMTALLSFFSRDNLRIVRGDPRSPLPFPRPVPRPGVSPQCRQSLEACDCQQPGGNRGPPLEPTRLTPYVEKHLADQILRDRFIPNQTQYEPDKRVHGAVRTAPAWRAGRRTLSVRSGLRPMSLASPDGRLARLVAGGCDLVQYFCKGLRQGLSATTVRDDRACSAANMLIPLNHGTKCSCRH